MSDLKSPRVNTPNFNPTGAIVFSLLFLSSLAIPAVHYFMADGAIANIRQVWTEPDGAATPLLTHVLFLKLLGKISWSIPVLLLVAFLLSCKIERLRRFSTLMMIAVAQCIFVTLYAAYCCRVFSHFMLGLPN